MPWCFFPVKNISMNSLPSSHPASCGLVLSALDSVNLPMPEIVPAISLLGAVADTVFGTFGSAGAASGVRPRLGDVAVLRGL